MDGGAWWAAVCGVATSQTWLSNFTFTVHFHALEKEMATHYSVLAWRIPGTAEPGGLPSTGLHRVRHDWSDLAAAAAAAGKDYMNTFFLSLQLHGLEPARLLCSWNSPGKNTGMGSRSLLQEVILTQELNPGLLHCESESEVAQSCLTLCDPMDCSLPGSTIHGIFQARILEWVAISFSRRSSLPRDWTQVSCIVGRHFTIWATRVDSLSEPPWLDIEHCV